jgi:hypothetical protein
VKASLNIGSAKLCPSAAFLLACLSLASDAWN